MTEAHDGTIRPPQSDGGPAEEPCGTPLSLSVLGAVAGSECRADLLDHGFVLDDADGLTTVLTDSYLRPELAEFNECALRARRPWLLANPSASVMWIGPVFRPEEGCCWKCLEARLRRNRPFEYHLIRGTYAVGPLDVPDGSVEDHGRFASFARELSRALPFLTCSEPTDSILIIDPADGRRSHRIPRRPQCPACGNARLYGQHTAVPVSLRSQPKRSSDGGACRVAGAGGETVVRFGALLDPLVGAVHDLEPLGTGEEPVRVLEAHYGDEPRPHDTALSACLLGRSSGKGSSDVEARISGLGEAIERYSACFQGDEPRTRASREDLGEAAIHPNLCMQFSDAQYQGRVEWNRRCAPWDRVPVPLDPRRRLDWTPVWPLSGGGPRYLPTMLLYSGYPAGPEEACCASDPSGGAAGNTLEEAILQGLLELVERDSLALWWYNRASRPQVDLAGVLDQDCRSVLSYHRSQDRESWVLDVTSDLGIPAFVAVSRRVGAGAERIVLGAGAHLDPDVALRRAVVEMDQILTCLTAWECDGSLGLSARDWLRCATLENQPYLAPEPVVPARLQDMPHLATSDIDEDIRVCERLLTRHGLEVMVLDQTRPDLGVPVAKVIVPGLRHFRRRLAPGRLYTAPVAAGWLQRPRMETDLNPTGFFL